MTIERDDLMDVGRQLESDADWQDGFSAAVDQVLDDLQRREHRIVELEEQNAELRRQVSGVSRDARVLELEEEADRLRRQASYFTEIISRLSSEKASALARAGVAEIKLAEVLSGKRAWQEETTRDGER